MVNDTRLKLGSNSGPKLGSNPGPKLGSNPGPKLGFNPGPRIGANHSRIPSNGGGLGTNWGVGIHGQPIQTGSQGREQKINVPCNFFRNTSNTTSHMNRENVMNVSHIENTQGEFEFKSNYDIERLLKTHPDFVRLPPARLQAIIAGVLSGLMAAGGIVILCLWPPAGESVLSLCISAGAGMMVGGGIGGAENALKHGIRGTFTWGGWVADVAMSAFPTLITFGAASFTGYAVSGYMGITVQNVSEEMLEYVVKCATRAAVCVAGLVNTASEACKKVLKQERIDPITLVLCLVTGAMQGYGSGKAFSNVYIENKLVQLTNNLEQAFNEIYGEFWTSTNNMWRHINKHAREFPDIKDIPAKVLLRDGERVGSLLSPNTISALGGLEGQISMDAVGALYCDQLNAVLDNAPLLTHKHPNIPGAWNHIYFLRKEGARGVYVVTSQLADPAHPRKLVTGFIMKEPAFMKKLNKLIEKYQVATNFMARES